MTDQLIEGNIIDLQTRSIGFGSVEVSEGIIKGVRKKGAIDSSYPYILPGFIDAHIHIESSMLVPSEFARLAVVHGTVATISDPHEIANVCGIDGVKYMIENGRKQPFKFFFGASPCVPATAFETAGASLSVDDLEILFRDENLHYMSEMMNYPGVLSEDPEIMRKIALAKKYNKPIDGHAPGVRGEDAKRYIEAGISTDHECFTLEEALEKISYGMKIIIREGSAAKNFDALHPLLRSHPEKVMFCSDDKHPDALVEGHINQLVKRALGLGYDLFDILNAACIHPVKHYNIPVGTLQEGHFADFIIIDNIENFNILATYINGAVVAKNNKTLLKRAKQTGINQFNTKQKTPKQFSFKAENGKLKVIEALDGQLITQQLQWNPKVKDKLVVPDDDSDILKMAVVNRYKDAQPAIAFVKNFGLKKGAIASSVAHDSHNIIAVGVDDRSICQAVNAIIEHQGGVAVVDEDCVDILPLPIAGLMSSENGYEVSKKYSTLDRKAKQLGSQLQAPFMTLSFMALLVIPNLKLSDLGLFDCNTFSFTHPYIEPPPEDNLSMEEMANRIKNTKDNDIIKVPKK